MIFWPLLLYTLLVLLIVGGVMIGLSSILGQRHKERATGEIYESGIVTTGDTKLRFSSHFYLVAMFFVIFDLEAVFLVAWALVAREAGWIAYWSVVVFIGILVAVLVYEWRLGALDFGADGKKILKKYNQLKNK